MSVCSPKSPSVGHGHGPPESAAIRGRTATFLNQEKNMRMKQRWYRVPGECVLPFYGDWHGNRWEWAWEANDKPLSPELAAIVSKIEAGAITDGLSGEIIVHFRSSGYYDPGRTGGPPEDCYPPEGDEERTLDYAEIALDGTTQRLSEEQAKIVWDECEEAVYEVEIDP